jgi:rfaE bifunctional protein kinase chain/domain
MKISQILSKVRLVEILSKFEQVRAGVIGDFALDAYWLVDMRRSRLSRETPHFPRPVVEERYSPGAGGNVAQNLAALGLKKVAAFCVIGEDAWGGILRDRLAEQKVSTQGLLPQAGRHTPAYIKPILMGYDARQEDARLDFENLEPLSEQAEEALLKALEEQLESLDTVLISDQMEENGVITPHMRQRLSELADQHPNICFLADSRQRISLFRNMVLKPNRLEALAAIQPGSDPNQASPDAIEGAGRALVEQTHQAVYLTLGEQGALVCTPAECQVVLAAPVRDPLDITGAGDAFLAALAAGLAAGATALEAGAIANLAAAVTVEKLGQTGTASPEEIMERYEMAAQSLLPAN